MLINASEIEAPGSPNNLLLNPMWRKVSEVDSLIALQCTDKLMNLIWESRRLTIEYQWGSRHFIKLNLLSGDTLCL